MFYMVLCQKPVSLGAQHRRGYQEILRQEAERRLPAHPCYSAGDLYARIVWFHPPVGHSRNPPDVDNIVKPILDALKGVAYGDDRQVARLATSHHEAVELRDSAVLSPEARDELAAHAAGLPYQDILYVEVGRTTMVPPVFGPVDGVTPA